MKKIQKILYIIVLACIMSSCTGLYQSTRVPATSFSPDFVRLDIKLNDFELLGETEISYASRHYLGIINILDVVNDSIVNIRDIESVNFVGEKDMAISPYMRRAAVKVVEEYPAADYYMPVYSKRRVEKMFLGRKVSEKMIIKVYNLKDEFMGVRNDTLR